MAISVSLVENYENYGRCVKVTNGIIEAFVTIDLGPRIIRYAFVDGTNVMFNDLERKGCNHGEPYDKFFYEGAKWYIYGGHRLWVTPESIPETYYPDNDPVEYTVTTNGAIFTPPAQIGTNIQLQIELQMADDKAEMKVFHRVTNLQKTPKEYAIWTISVMAQNGLEIVPQNTHNTGLLANRTVSLWPYTDVQDDRFYFGTKYITLLQNPNAKSAFKLGTDNKSGYAIFATDDVVFINHYSPKHPNGNYPDGGVSFETYTDGLVLELETLDEVKTVAPGATSEYIETWELKKNPGTPDRRDETAIDAFVKKIIGE